MKVKSLVWIAADMDMTASAWGEYIRTQRKQKVDDAEIVQQAGASVFGDLGFPASPSDSFFRHFFVISLRFKQIW